MEVVTVVVWVEELDDWERMIEGCCLLLLGVRGSKEEEDSVWMTPGELLKSPSVPVEVEPEEDDVVMLEAVEEEYPSNPSSSPDRFDFGVSKFFSCCSCSCGFSCC